LPLSTRKVLNLLSSELESPIMEILWARGPLRGRDLYEEIRREKSIAYTTALTVLDRLAKKGFVRKNRASGTIMFSAALARETYESEVIEGLVGKAFAVSPDLAVSAFADLFSQMPREDFARLEKLVEDRKNAKRS